MGIPFIYPLYFATYEVNVESVAQVVSDAPEILSALTFCSSVDRKGYLFSLS
jgi:hypothetical protein